MFKNPEFQQHSTVDKRGRKVEKRKNQENMRKYYKLKDEVCLRALSARMNSNLVACASMLVCSVHNLPPLVESKTLCELWCAWCSALCLTDICLCKLTSHGAGCMERGCSSISFCAVSGTAIR